MSKPPIELEPLRSCKQIQEAFNRNQACKDLASKANFETGSWSEKFLLPPCNLKIQENPVCTILAMDSNLYKLKGTQRISVKSMKSHSLHQQEPEHFLQQPAIQLQPALQNRLKKRSEPICTR